MLTNAETSLERSGSAAVAMADVPVVPEVSLQGWADRITQASGQAVEAILHIGRVLLAAKQSLPHGQWERLFKWHPQAVAQPVPFSVKTALMHMKIARHPILSNSNLSYCLPPSWRTLYELTFLPDPVLERLLTTGVITPELRRDDAVRLRDTDGGARSSQGREPMRQQELVDITLLTFHPSNYRQHPDDQLEHLMRSIAEHGFYRNVVVARDNTILAGQGIMQAAAKMGLQQVPVVRLDLDPLEPRALKVLTGDNETGKLASVMDGQLNELLRDLKGDLIGTGFDELQVSALAQLTRPPDALMSKNEAEEWARLGMPECDPGGTSTRMVIQFRNDEDREKFVAQCNIEVTKRGRQCVVGLVATARPRRRGGEMGGDCIMKLMPRYPIFIPLKMSR